MITTVIHMVRESNDILYLSSILRYRDYGLIYAKLLLKWFNDYLCTYSGCCGL